MSKKTSNLISTVLALLLVLTATFAAFQIFPAKVYGLNLSNSVSMSPMTLTLSGLPQTSTYWVNVTSGGTDYINAVDVSIPVGWTYAGSGAASGYGFGAPTALNNWVNFTTALTTFYGGAIANFSIPIAFSTMPTTVGTWTIYCYQVPTASSSNPVTITVTANLQFHSTMSPNYVAGGSAYVYNITATNDLSPIGINAIDITFPTGTWVFNVLNQYSPSTWSVVYTNPTFYLTGPNILEGQTVSIMVNMTVPSNTASNSYPWTITAFNSNNQNLGNYTMPAVVDSNAPTITPSAPTGGFYSVGSGNYVWINVTIADLPSMATYFSQYSVTVNDTRFTLQSAVKSTDTSYNYYYENTTAIPDGPLAVKITAVDPAGNSGTGNAVTTVDNTAPRLISLSVEDQASNALHQSGGTYWMQASTTYVSIAAAFYNLAGITGTIYFNSTSYVFTNSTSSTVWIPGTGINGYPVAGSNVITLNITLTDTASPNHNRYSFTWTIMRDLIPPSAPTYTKTATICGGFIIWGLTATDNVGVNSYNIYLNTTRYVSLPTSTLNSPTLTSITYGYVVQNVTVINLFGNGFSAGDVANITVAAVDYGSNVGNATSLSVTVPAGQWYAIEMQPKWNLISFPLLPNSTATTDIFSKLLVHGAAGVNVAYGFNNAAKTWTLNPATMTDGNGYWIYMNNYDVLIVQGFPASTPPGSPPPIIQYPLTTGWNLAGFTETTPAPGMAAWQYVASLQSASYFRWLDAWDPSAQQWVTIDTATSNPIGTQYITPGQGFFIYTYSAQTLIPPV